MLGKKGRGGKNWVVVVLDYSGWMEPRPFPPAGKSTTAKKKKFIASQRGSNNFCRYSYYVVEEGKEQHFFFRVQENFPVKVEMG